MSRWHVEWQARFPQTWREVRVGCRIADIRLPSGYVIEFQHSPMNLREVSQRKRDYGDRMAWVWDARRPRAEGRLTLARQSNPLWRRFSWAGPRRDVTVCRNSAFLDLGDGWLVNVYQKSLAEDQRSQLVGTGYLVSRAEFVARALQEGKP